MKKFLLLGIGLLFAGCTQQSTNLSPTTVTQKPAVQTASATVGYINFEAQIATDSDLKEFGIDKKGKENQTFVLLSLNNHQQNLEDFNYQERASLDGQPANSWQILSNGMGGHHMSGLLTFPKNDNPKILSINGLPVGEAQLFFGHSQS